MTLSKRLARVERLAPPPPPPPPPEPEVDTQKLIRALIALAESDDSAADHLTDEERRVMDEQLPSVEAIRAYIDGMRRRPQDGEPCD